RHDSPRGGWGRRRRRTGAVHPAGAGAERAVGPVALLARLVDGVVTADRRRSAGAVGAAATGAEDAVGPVALLARLVHLVVAAHGAGEVRCPVDADAGAGGTR